MITSSSNSDSRPAPPGEQPAGAVTEHVDVRARDRGDHPARHRLGFHAQLRVHARDDHVDAREQLLVLVERAVVEDVDLDAGEDAERREILVELRRRLRAARAADRPTSRSRS